MAVDFDLDDDIIRRLAQFGMAPLAAQSEHIKDRQDGMTIQKVMNQTGNIGIAEGGAAPLVDRVSLVQTAEQVQQLRDVFQGLNDQAVPEAFEFPNLAWESLKVGLAREGLIHDKLNQHIDKIQEKHGDISRLLELNTELSKANEENKEISDRAQALIDQLQARGIDIRGENIAEMKRTVGAQESRLRSEIQIAFTTDVQRLMQEDESMNQILQSIIRYLDRLLSRINQNSKTQ